MHVSRILVYPIKSLRAYEPPSHIVTKHGFAYDRRFMVLQVQEDGTLKNMHIAHFPELSLMFASINFPEDLDPQDATINLTWKPPQGDQKTTEIPLLPDTTDLEKIEVTMHNSPTGAYKMPSQYNDWLSSCLGYTVILAYLGEYGRPVLMSTHNNPHHETPSSSTSATSSWLSTLTSKLPTYITGPSTPEAEKITFADCAPFLVVSETSLADVSDRLPEGEEMDVTKFRPNIVVTGAEDKWEEDFWSELKIGGSGVTLHLEHNCFRCQSLNIDYETGKLGTGESGKILKKLQSDRRVDKGAKYSAVFGRYSFLGKGCDGMTLAVGDEVQVVARNVERTRFDWPGLGSG